MQLTKDDPISAHIMNGIYRDYIDCDTDVWVIGDIHGCADEFREICSIIRERNPEAVIVQLGDLIDRGPYLYEVFEVVRDYDVQVLIGNHELNFLIEWQKLKGCYSRARRQTHFQFEDLVPEKQDFIIDIMKSCRNSLYWIRDDGMGFFMTHAPMKGYSTSFNEYEHVGNAWNYCSSNEPYPLAEIRNEIQIHGHQHWNYIDIDQQLDAVQIALRDSINVDSGCVYGHYMLALNLGSVYKKDVVPEYIKVHASKNYAESGEKNE